MSNLRATIAEATKLAMTNQCQASEAHDQARARVVTRLTSANAKLGQAEDGNLESLFAKTDSKASLLNAFQVVAAGSGAKQVATDPINYYFTNKWRLYVRSTLAFDEPDDDEKAEAEATAGAEPSIEDLAESVKLALQDPYAGGLNISAGFLTKVPFKFLVGAANDAQHGLFVDSRVGLRFVGLPEDKMSLTTANGKDGETKATPFYQASTALRLILPIFREDKGHDNPGGVEIALTGALSRVAYQSASSLFASANGSDPLLETKMATLHLAMAFKLPGWASLNLSTTLWNSNKFEKRYLVGVTISDTSKGNPETTAEGKK